MGASDEYGLERVQSTDSGTTLADVTELVDATSTSIDLADAYLVDAEIVAFECPIVYGIPLKKDEAEAMHGLPSFNVNEKCGLSSEKCICNYYCLCSVAGAWDCSDVLCDDDEACWGTD